MDLVLKKIKRFKTLISIRHFLNGELDEHLNYALKPGQIYFKNLLQYLSILRSAGNLFLKT